MEKLVKIYHCGDVYEIPLMDALEYVRAHLNQVGYNRDWGKPLMSGIINLDAPNLGTMHFRILEKRLEAML